MISLFSLQKLFNLLHGNFGIKILNGLVKILFTTECSLKIGIIIKFREIHINNLNVI